MAWYVVMGEDFEKPDMTEYDGESEVAARAVFDSVVGAFDRAISTDGITPPPVFLVEGDYVQDSAFADHLNGGEDFEDETEDHFIAQFEELDPHVVLSILLESAGYLERAELLFTTDTPEYLREEARMNAAHYVTSANLHSLKHQRSRD